MREGNVPWYYQPVWIVVLTLTVLGPFSLWLVWKSPSMSPASKTVFTVVILGASFMFCWVTWAAAVAVYEHYQQMYDTMGY